MTRTGVTALAASMLLGACAAGPEIREPETWAW